MITVNINKAKEIAHDKRREARAEEFKQLDIQATIPMFAEQAEQKRQEIRDKYAQIQTDIDNATDEQEVKEAINDLLCSKKL
jgi:hypothetical protein